MTNIFSTWALLCALLLLLLLRTGTLTAQATPRMVQNIKGVVTDKALKTPLVGATVTVTGAEPGKGAITDAEGRFRIAALPVGKYALRVTYLGYKPYLTPDFSLNSGKETDLTLELEEDIIAGKEVVITARPDKQKPLNELSAVSTRAFSVEETQRFAAAVNDPARMAASFAGVSMPSDGNNVIVIRGNAPNGLLWRMEGVDIPNPNHFSSVGTSGGGISILSAQVLTQSDFLTGAFPAEYGNAGSGVFDLRLRKGNTDRREYTFQAGVLGIDAAAEGPIRMGRQTGSYLVNYRYSTLSVLGHLGVPLGDAVTNFQDLSWNVLLPAGKAGVFTFFGMGGKSDQRYHGTADSLYWIENPDAEYDGLFVANAGVAGITHSLLPGPKTAIKTVAAVSGTRNADETERYDGSYRLYQVIDNAYIQRKYTLTSTLNHKFNARHLLRAGAYVNLHDYSLRQKLWYDEENALREVLTEKGKAMSANAFAQWQYRASPRWTWSAGLHAMTLLLNHTWSVEPRGSVRYAFDERQSLSLGYGKHGQMHPLGTYFVQIAGQQGELSRPNHALGMTRAHHLVLSYDRSWRNNWHFKPEMYYQFISKAPVNGGASDAFSLLNNIQDIPDKWLVNTGQGRNYGMELTVERFLTKGFYGMWSSSLFRSEYRGSNGVWHHTRFDAGYINTLTAGKEWNWNTSRKNRTIGLNVKCTHSGGLRDTPIDLDASIEQGKAVYDDTRAFEDRMPYYLRLDAGVRIKRNYPRITTTLSFDVQNVTNRKNVLLRYYDAHSHEIKSYAQAPLLPILAYKIEFGG